MIRSQRRLLYLMAAVPVVVVLMALVYMAGMRHLEGDPRSFWQAVAWTAETLTTTGYGSDVAWDNPWMVLFVVVLQFAGVFFVFLVFPIYLIPVLEERFQARLPRTVPRQENHVIVFGYSPSVATLLPQLERAGVDTLVIESQEGPARRLMERGQRLLVGRLEDHVLEKGSLGAARALIANSTDIENAAVILAARQMSFEGEVLALVEDPLHRRPLSLAGASRVFTPRHVLGAALAARASSKISPRLAGVQRLGEHLEVREVKIGPGSALAGTSLAESAVASRTGATVIGQWVDGRLDPEPTAETVVSAQGTLVVAGSPESLTRLEELARGAPGSPREGAYIVAGYGEVGRKVAQLLRDVGEPVMALDREPHDGVDQVGDVLDPHVLDAIDVAQAQAVILALDNDSATLFATVILKEVAPLVPVIARVNRVDNVERIHRAGVDFALSISQVSGQILAFELLGEEAVAVNPQLKVRRLAVPTWAGKRPRDLQIRRRTGCSVVAVERGDETLVELGGEFRFEPGDRLFVSGPEEAVSRFGELESER